MNVQKVRRWVALGLIVGLTVVSLVVHGGTGTFEAWGIGSIAALCPVGALESFLGAKDVNLQGIGCAVLALVAVVAVGKAFCSWACPVPWLQKFFRPRRGRNHGAEKAAAVPSPAGESSEDASELVSASSVASPCASSCAACASACASAAGKRLPPVGGTRDGVRIDGRHLVLGGALGSALVFGFPVFCLVCPVGLSFATLVGVWHLFQFNETTWGLVVFPLILIAEVVLLRKWCTRLCPISALLSLVSCANKTLRPSVNEEACLRTQGVDCHRCVDACPQSLDPHSGLVPECTKCHQCADACPAHAIRFPVLRPRKDTVPVGERARAGGALADEELVAD